MNNEPVFETIAHTNFPAQAEVIRSVLASGGFEAFVINQNAPTYVGLVDSVCVIVESSQAEASLTFCRDSVFRWVSVRKPSSRCATRTMSPFRWCCSCSMSM